MSAELDPSVHSYLGMGLEDATNRADLDQIQTLTLPIVLIENVIIFPGETLPLRIRNLNLIASLRAHNVSSVLLGVVGIESRVLFHRRSARIAAVGTVVEACSTHINGDEVTMIAKGRRRFRLASHPSLRIQMTTVELLPEDDDFVTCQALHSVPWYQKCNPHPAWVYNTFSPLSLMETALALYKKWKHVRKYLLNFYSLRYFYIDGSRRWATT